MDMGSTWRIAWRNLGRSRKRTALACAAIALGQFAFLASAAIMHGYAEQYLRSVTGPLVGHIQAHAQGWREEQAVEKALEEVGDMLAAIRRQPQVLQASPRVYAPVLVALDREASMGMVVGIDPAVETGVGGLLYGVEVAELKTARRVWVGRGFARQQGIATGAELAVIGQDLDGSIASELYEVAGVIASPVEIVDRVGIVMAIDDARALLRLGEAAHEIIVHLRNPDAVAQMAGQIAALEELGAAEVKPWYEVVPQFAGIIELMDIYTLFILVIVFLAAAAGIANTMLMSVFERQRELGMLLALGCGPGRLAQIVAAEAICLGLLGVALGTALGLAFAGATADAGFDFVALAGEQSFEVGYQGLQISSRVFPILKTADVLEGVGAVLLTAFASCLWPLLHIARLEPMEAMRP
jgi:putative ABC transport system permease protein